MEPLELTRRNGEKITVQAEVLRTPTPMRIGRSVGLTLVSLILVVPAALVPPHGLFSVALLGSAVFGSYVWWTRGLSVGRIEGTCPACGAALAVPHVGAWSDDLWARCAGCREPYRVGRPA